jgi:hypothetical protein
MFYGELDFHVTEDLVEREWLIRYGIYSTF